MKILTYPLGQMQANCYFLIEGNECLILDPADEASFILEQLQRNRLKLVGMLATHGHFDHIMAAGEIQKSLDAPLYLHEKDELLVERLEDTAKYFLGYNPVVLKPNTINRLIVFKNQMKNFKFEVLLCPGHTPGSVAYYFRQNKVVFTGDTLFKKGIGRYDFSYSNKMDLKKSLQKLLKLPKDIVVYPGHGELTTIKSEQGIFELYTL